MGPCDHHVHLERGPYERSWLERFLKTAAARGVGEVGFVEHLYLFKEAVGLLGDGGPGGLAASPVRFIDERYTRSIDEFLAFVERARQDGLPVKVGVEFDYHPEDEEAIGRFLDTYPFDYRIGSVHCLNSLVFDMTPDIPFWQSGDIRAIYADYFRMLARLARSGLADIIGHSDVIKVWGHRPSGPGAEAFLREQYESLAEAVAAGRRLGPGGRPSPGDARTAVEINTAGWRKPVGEVYPGPGLLAAFKTDGVPIVFSSDAHDPRDVGADFDRAMAYAREAGYQSTVEFAGRRASEKPIAEA
ncbi:MAG TPA: histidinol-phosphatase [Bacillota bacterium]